MSVSLPIPAPVPAPQTSSLHNRLDGRLTSVDVVQGPTWAEDGIQGIDMAGTPGPGSLTQILTTAAGTDYVLSFWYPPTVARTRTL